MRRSNALGCFLALSMIAGGCFRKSNDEDIQKDIQTRIAADVKTQSSQVQVTSKKGSVKLTGKVKSDTAKVEVKKIATEEPGVSSVDD